MNNNQMTCDPERIELFLRQQLNDEEQTAFELHLDDCNDCHHRLEATAAGDEIWSGVRDSLLGQELPLDGLWSGDSILDSELDSAGGGDESFSHGTVLKWLAPTDDDRMLGRLGTYEVLGIIGSGGMGVVLKAFDAALNRYVAIKVLAPHLGSSGAARKRFSREAQAAAAVVHDNVIEIHGVADADGLPYLVMPYVRGPSLQRRLDCEGPLALVEILRIGMQAATGLAAAHAQGLVHRDIKPANILLADGVERVKLTDFGLARAADDASLTKTGVIAGTPQFMSPEQARGESVDQRSDLFSLGSVLYAMCTGRAPFRAETSYGVLRRLTDEEPKAIREINPDIPEWLCQIIAKLMSKQLDDRFESALEVADLLEECLAHVQQPNVAPLPQHSSLRASPASKPQRRSPVFKFFIGAAFAFSLIFAGILVVLELNKGTLTIESQADNVHVRITQGDKVVEKLTITRTGASVRIAAGRYEIELLTETDGLVVKNGRFTLTRGKEHVVTIERVEASAPKAPSVGRAETDEAQLWNAFGVTPAPVSPLTAKVLEWIGLHLWPITKDRFRDKNVFAKYPGGLDLTFVRTHGPAEKAGIHDVDIVVRLQGRRISSLQHLDAAMQYAVEQLKRGDANSLQFHVLRNGDTVRVNVPFPVSLFDLLASNSISNSTAQSGESQPKTTNAKPKRVRQFATGKGLKIAYSADGKLIAIANGNPTRILRVNGTSRVKGNWKPSADILDAETGKTIVSLKLSTNDEDAVLAATGRVSHFEVGALAFSPDGKVVAVGTSIGQVKLFNARTGKLIRLLDDKPARLADKKTPENWRLLKRAMGSVASLAFSPDGSLLAMCGNSFGDYSDVFDGVSRLGFRATGPGRLKVWEVKTGTLKHDLAGHTDHANAVSFSPDGHLLASAGRWLKDGDWGDGVILWSTHTGTQIRSFRTTANGGTRSVAFSPDSKLLAIGTQRFDKDKVKDASTGAVSLVHISTGIVDWLVTVPGWAKPVAFSPDGKSVAVLCGGRSIRFLEVEAGKVKHEIRAADSPQGGRWTDFAIASQSQTLAISGVDNDRKVLKGSVELWHLDEKRKGRHSADSTTNTRPRRVSRIRPDGHVNVLARSPDGKLIAIANGTPPLILQRNGTSKVKGNWKPSAEILDVVTGKTVVSLKLATMVEEHLFAATERISHFEVVALAFSPDGKVVAVGTSVGQVKLFGARTGELVRTLDDKQAKLADKESPKKWKSLARAMGSVKSLAFSPDGSLLAVCGSSFADFSDVFDGVERLGELGPGPGRLKVWEVKTGALKHDLSGHSHANAVSFSPDGNWLASAGRATGVILWNPQTGKQLRRITTNDNGGAHSVAFSPDSKLMAISWLNTDIDKVKSGISLTHTASGITDWRRTFPGSAKSVAFSPDGNSFAVLCGGQSIRFLEAYSGTVMREIRSANFPKGGRWNDFAIMPQGQMLAIGGVDSEGKGSVELRNLAKDQERDGPGSGNDEPDPASDADAYGEDGPHDGGPHERSPKTGPQGGPEGR